MNARPDTRLALPRPSESLRSAARSWCEFFFTHTQDHPAGECPAVALYESYRRWARDTARPIADFGDVVAWTVDVGYRLSPSPRLPGVLTGQVPAVWHGLVGREYDPAGWPEGWFWPGLHLSRPPSWHVARSRMAEARARGPLGVRPPARAEEAPGNPHGH